MATGAQIILPDDLVSELDELVGPRGRNQYIAEAVREKLLRERQQRALILAAGLFADEDLPEWATPERTSDWINRGRQDIRELPGRDDN